MTKRPHRPLLLTGTGVFPAAGRLGQRARHLLNVVLKVLHSKSNLTRLDLKEGVIEGEKERNILSEDITRSSTLDSGTHLLSAGFL